MVDEWTADGRPREVGEDPGRTTRPGPQGREKLACDRRNRASDREAVPEGCSQESEYRRLCGGALATTRVDQAGTEVLRTRYFNFEPPGPDGPNPQLAAGKKVIVAGALDQRRFHAAVRRSFTDW